MWHLNLFSRTRVKVTFFDQGCATRDCSLVLTKVTDLETLSAETSIENAVEAGYKHYENTPIQIYRKFSDKKTDIFCISAQNIDCGCLLELPQRGSSNKYLQSMFLSRNKKNNVYPCKPQFYCIKVRFKGFRILQVCFRDEYRIRTD